MLYLWNQQSELADGTDNGDKNFTSMNDIKPSQIAVMHILLSPNLLNWFYGFGQSGN